MSLSTTYTKTETDYKLQELQKLSLGGLKGSIKITDSAPTVQGLYLLSDVGTYANLGGLVTTAGKLNYAYFDGTTWSKVEVAMQEVNTLQEITNNVLQNPEFKDARTYWSVNENFTVNVVDGVLSMDTQGTTDPALYQVVPSLKAGNYIMSIKIKNKTNTKQSIRVGIAGSPKTIDVEVGDTFNIFNVDINVNSDITNAVIVINPNPNVQLEIDSCYLFQANNNFITNLIKTYYENIPFAFSKSIVVTQGAESVSITVNSPAYVFDVAGGYRILNHGNLVVNLEETVYLSATENIYTEVDMSLKGTGQTVYLIKERYDAARTKLRNNLIGINYYGWSTQFSAFEIKTQSSSSNSKWMPSKSNIISPFRTYLKPFIQKYFDRTEDVTIVQIGDSISTDLNWTDKRPDANERPPFCTEYNVNSYVEEKLRWKEQKYRRFDFGGVFTEILGGGTSTAKNTDNAWGLVGASFYFPITKVIDGGNNAGVSFKLPANNKRLSLIVHTDYQFASQTKVVIAEGNGKVEVWNGSAWVEANNFTISFKESNTQIVGAVDTFYKDNAQKRLKFRNVDLAEKTITVQNVGSGRFGYWGIEYSPNDYMFTYICASKGSHSIARLQQYETWMVDSFNPDLVLWQMPILNEGFGVAARGWHSGGFNVQFKNKFDSLNGKGYLVLPYILWAANYSEFVDNNGNFLSGLANGKIVSPFADVANIMSVFSSNDYPVINLFNLITEAAINKAKEENGNIYSSALVGSGKNGNTFTIDGIHMNKLGSEVVFNMLEPYFNF